MLKSFILKNGLKVATYNLPNLKSVHILMVSKGGALAQDRDKNGIAHLLEHLLVQGIPSYPTAEGLAAFVEGLAGSYGAFTQQLLIGFEITVPAAHLKDALKISSEVFFKPLFEREAFAREKGVVISEMKQRMDSKYYKIYQFSQQSRFSLNHPLAQDIGGSIPDIEKLTKEDLISFWQKYFYPHNTYLIVVGNFQTTTLEKLLKQYFAELKNGVIFPGYQKMSEKDFSATHLALKYNPALSSDYLDLTFPTINLSHSLDLRIKQSLALSILGRLRNSRLFKLLRYQKGLVYDVRSSYSLLPDLGYIHITSEVLPQNLEEVMNLIVRELKNFVLVGPTEEELRFAKNYIINGWQMAFDHPSSIAGWLEGELLWEEKVTLPEDHAKIIEPITVSDIVEMMQKHWNFKKAQLSIQGPTRKTKESLAKYEGMVEKLQK